MPKKAKGFLILAVWLIGTAASMPLAVRLTYIEDASICTNVPYEAVHQIAYAGCYIIIGWILPGIIFTTLYFKTARQLKLSEDYHSNARVMQQQIRRENKQVVKMFVVVVALFFTFTMPNTVYQIVYHYLYLFDDITGKGYLGRIYTILPCVSAMNSCINPLIYAKMHKEFNRYVRGLMFKLRRFACPQNAGQCDAVSSIQKDNSHIENVSSGNGLLPKAVMENTNCR